MHDGDWKLIRIFHRGNDGAHRWKLFNLSEDIREKHDLADTEPTRLKQMDSLIEAFLNKTNAVRPVVNPRFDPVQYDPSREGVGRDRTKARPKRKKPNK